ncbi:MAG: ribosome maturation factor RimP, partial [Clostridia bacterium]|nr:ribosome maturation factor RimP [Clostridia bacterium]
CSPGIERELTRPEHFEAMAGREVCVTLFRAIDGEKEVIAELVGLRDKQIVLRDLDGVEFEIPKKDAVSVRLTDEDE